MNPRVDRGSITLRLPHRSQRIAESQRIERWILNPHTSRRILLVDDDRGLSLALSTLLKDAGHDVETAGDGPDALALLRERAFDIVLLDIGLPTMSGLDVLAQARALAKPPLVIMMTADDTPETVLESVRRQAFRYLRKPFPPNDHRRGRQRRVRVRGRPVV